LRIFLYFALFQLICMNLLIANPNSNPQDPHAAIYQEELYPSASKCASCHYGIYEEWRASAHAYASLSPVFHKFEQAISSLSNGTIGTFCMRCHASVSTTINEPREAPMWERLQVSREGITCITCHRVSQEYYKENGERRIEPGPIEAPMYGPFDDQDLKKIIDQKQHGDRRIHQTAIKFEQLSQSEACVSCHQVAVAGIKLEVVWDQYQASPAKEKNISCQDCHMAKIPGDYTSGYDEAPPAIIKGVSTPKKKHANHAFVGPGYSIVHPGIFPHNPEAQSFTMQQWLSFDHRAGWGSDAFEDALASGSIQVNFPTEWANKDQRQMANRIIEQNLKTLEKRKKQRKEVLEHSIELNGPFFDQNEVKTDEALSFYYEVTNQNIGHNLPSGSLGAQPELWLNVSLVDPDQKVIWESGHLDSIGDMCDLHSMDVLNGILPEDKDLFNLQTKFLVTNLKGTDREAYLPVNFDIDQIPMIRPATVPTTVMNHPPFVRMEGRSLAPLKTRKANYHVPSSLIKKPGKYILSARMRSRAEPIYFMKFIGATDEMIKSMNEGIVDLHSYSVEFTVQAK
jgi:nitrate/TMAO reductase-like tetraheme cytochrome c subunit